MNKSRVAPKIIVLTDAAGYELKTKRLGHLKTQKITENFLNVGKTLITQNNGKILKSTGDGHLGILKDYYGALKTAVALKQFFKYAKNAEFRIIFYSGIVEEARVIGFNDIFGPDVIKASRLESKIKDGVVVVNERFMEDISKIEKQEAIKRYFKAKGKFKTKLSQRSEKFYTFDWESYAKDRPEQALNSLIIQCLESSGVDILNINASFLFPTGTIIWPVVPRGILTVIHKGQIEILRLLSILGWQVHLLITDCGIEKITKKEINNFISAIKKYSQKREIVNIKTSLLSEYFDDKFNREYKKSISRFKEIISELTIDDFSKITNKNYDKKDQKEVRAQKILKGLHPILSKAIVENLIEKVNKKIIVLAGHDENYLWRSLINKYHGRVIVAFNPEFKKGKFTIKQESRWPQWLSKKDLLDDMKKTNACYWAFVLFVQLPNFPCLKVKIPSGKEVCAKDWKNEYSAPSLITKEQVADMAWRILGN